MQRQSHNSTVFSLPIQISVVRSGTTVSTFTADEIISLSYQATAPDIGFSGIMTTSISVTLANKSSGTPACQKGDTIQISDAGSFSDYYVQDRSFDTYTTNFTAYDCCSKIEVDFDTTNFVDTETVTISGKSVVQPKLYTQAQVISAMSTQLSITIVPPTDIGIKFSKSDLSGSCRSILEAISEINGCMFVCVSNQIQAVMYKDYIATANVNDYGEVLSDSSSLTFDGLVVTDTTYNKEYHYGSNKIFRYIESALVKGDSSVGGALYNRFVSATYNSFTMSNAVVSYFTPTMPQQITYDTSRTAIALNMSANYTAGGWIVQYSSPEAHADVDTYESKDIRLMDLLLKQGVHGNILVDKNYGGLVYDNV